MDIVIAWCCGKSGHCINRPQNLGATFELTSILSILCFSLLCLLLVTSLFNPARMAV